MTIFIGINIYEVCSLVVKLIVGVGIYASASKMVGACIRHLRDTFSKNDSEIRKEVNVDE